MKIWERDNPKHRLVLGIVMAVIMLGPVRTLLNAYAPSTESQLDAEGPSSSNAVSDSLPEEPLEGGSGRLWNRGYAISDDDGELHVGWDASVSYSFRETGYELQGELKAADSALDVDVPVDIYVGYPQLEGAGEHEQEINAALYDAAMTSMSAYLTKPDEEALELMRKLDEQMRSSGAYEQHPLFSDEVTWAITYNTDDFISVSFSDWGNLGNASTSSFIMLRCVNANLKTGEIYKLDDVLQVNESMANAFVDAMVANSGEDVNGDGVVSDEECTTLQLVTRQEFVDGILGKGELAKRMTNTFFVDEKGRVNLGVSYKVGNDRGGWVHGWWDVTLTDEMLEGAKKDSTFWELVKAR